MDDIKIGKVLYDTYLGAYCEVNRTINSSTFEVIYHNRKKAIVRMINGEILW